MGLGFFCHHFGHFCCSFCASIALLVFVVVVVAAGLFLFLFCGFLDSLEFLIILGFVVPCFFPMVLGLVTLESIFCCYGDSFCCSGVFLLF